jgi:hypothetical protein
MKIYYRLKIDFKKIYLLNVISKQIFLINYILDKIVAEIRARLLYVFRHTIFYCLYSYTLSFFKTL